MSATAVKIIESKKFAPAMISTIETMLGKDLADMDEKKSFYLAESAAKFFLHSYEDGWSSKAIELEHGVRLMSMGLSKTPKSADDTMRILDFAVLKSAAEKILEVYAAMRAVRMSLIKPPEAPAAEKLVMPE